MRYLLDTNAVIALLKNEPAIFRKRLRQAVTKGAAIGVSSIVLYELWYGVARSGRRRENAERLRVFLSAGVEVSPFDEEDVKTASELRATLEAAGTSIGPYDLMIAAQVLRVGDRQCRGVRSHIRPPTAGLDGKSVRRLAGVRPLTMIRLCPWGRTGATCTI